MNAWLRVQNRCLNPSPACSLPTWAEFLERILISGQGVSIDKLRQQRVLPGPSLRTMAGVGDEDRTVLLGIHLLTLRSDV